MPPDGISQQCRRGFRHESCSMPDDCDCECHDAPARGIHDAKPTAATVGRGERAAAVTSDVALACPLGCVTPKPLRTEQAVRVHWSRTHRDRGRFPGLGPMFPKPPKEPTAKPHPPTPRPPEPDMPQASSTDEPVPEWMLDAFDVARAVGFLTNTDPFDAMREVLTAWASEQRQDKDVALLLGILKKRSA